MFHLPKRSALAVSATAGRSDRVTRSPHHVLALLTVLALAIAVPVSASAETDGATTTTEGQAADSHCVTNVATQSSECFSSFPAAIAAATGGQVQDAPSDAHAAALDEGFTAKLNAPAVAHRQALASVVLGIEYEHSGYRGSSYIFYAPYGCDSSADADWQRSPMPGGWDNRVSSYRVYSNCVVDHWQNPGFTGRHTGLTGARSYIGDYMNDRTSSIRWH
jgi:hypothetical protein